jgi:hypothetical protein
VDAPTLRSGVHSLRSSSTWHYVRIQIVKSVILLSVSALIILSASVIFLFGRRNYPGELDLAQIGHVKIGSFECDFPIDSKKIITDFYEDGGTTVASFYDAGGNLTYFGLDGRMGSKTTNFYIGAKHPRKEGAVLIGDDPEYWKLFYSLLSNEEYNPRIYTQNMDKFYPRRWKYYFGKWFN